MDSQLIDRLAEHQRAVRDVIGRALPLLADEGMPAPLELGRLRWQQVRTLAAYQQFKHREIFDPAIARGGGGQLARMGEALKADCTEIGEAFTDYVREWSGRGTGDDWATYRRAALAMIVRIESHLDREERTVGSLLRAGRVAVPPLWPR